MGLSFSAPSTSGSHKESEGQIFRDEEFAAHLQRVAATEDDLPGDRPA